MFVLATSTESERVVTILTDSYWTPPKPDSMWAYVDETGLPIAASVVCAKHRKGPARTAARKAAIRSKKFGDSLKWREMTGEKERTLPCAACRAEERGRLRAVVPSRTSEVTEEDGQTLVRIIFKEPQALGYHEDSRNIATMRNRARTAYRSHLNRVGDPDALRGFALPLHEVEVVDGTERSVVFHATEVATEEVTTWADGFGVWHCKVSFPAPGYGPAKMDKDAHRIRARARKAIRAEVEARAPEGVIPPTTYVEVAANDLDHMNIMKSITYKEKTA